MIIVIALVFPLAGLTHIDRGNNIITAADHIQGNVNTTSITNVSNGEKNIVTSNCTPSYYIKHMSSFNQTGYQFNVSWYLNSNDNSLTENRIILKQDNRTLLAISYGRKDNCITTVSGSRMSNDTLNFSKLLVTYDVHIVFSKGMKNHALIWEGNSSGIPAIIGLKNPYGIGNISFMFGGKYSNQTISKINSSFYKRLITVNGLRANAFSSVESYNVSSCPMDKNHTEFIDPELNSIIYLSTKGAIERYNYYNENSSAIGNINRIPESNVSSFQYRGHFIYYTWNNTITNVYNINGTTLSISHLAIKNHNLTHLVLFNGSYVLYSMNGRFNFLNGNVTALNHAKILKVQVSHNISVEVLNGNIIQNYTILSNGTVDNNGSYAMDGQYNISYIYMNNGISSYFYENSTIMGLNGNLYHNISLVNNKMGSRRGDLLIRSGNGFDYTGISMAGSFSFSNGTIIINRGHKLSLYGESAISSPYKISIVSIKENTEFNKTIIAVGISSALNYTLRGYALGNAYTIQNNTIDLAFPHLKTGNYTLNLTAINEAGYSANKNYTFSYNDTVATVPVTTITGAKIMEKGNNFYVQMSGNNTKNATVAWYVNGIYSNSGNRLNMKLPMGIDKISAKISYGGKAYTAEKRIVVLGNLPYYIGIAGISIMASIFAVEEFYFNNKNVDDLLMELNGENIKRIIKSGRKKRISARRVNSRIKMLSGMGELFIERDMDNNKFVMTEKSFLRNKNIRDEGTENQGKT
jgi:hypothetical protein